MPNEMKVLTTNVLIEAATKFYALQMISRPLLENITIEILFVNGCGQGGTSMPPRPNYYLIILDGEWNILDQLLMLAHEMIHVSQIASGRFKLSYLFFFFGPVMAHWEGKMIGFFNKIPYEEHPWEIEAYDQAGQYFEQFYEFAQFVLG